MSLKKIDASIKRIVTNAAKLNTLIHETAMAIVMHAAPTEAGGNGHGDCSRAQHLVNAMPASMRRTMLVKWFTDFTPIVVKADQAGWDAKMHKPGTKLYVEWNVEAANATPFYTLAEQNPEGKALDFDALMKLVAGLATRIEKKVEEGKVPEQDVTSAQAISAALKALKVERATPANDATDPNNLDLSSPMERAKKMAAA